MSGGRKTDTSTQISEPWSEQIPYLKFGMSEADRLYRSGGPEYFSGSTVAGFSPEQQQAFGMGAQRAIGGNQSMKMAESFNQDVMRGKFSDDPYQGQVFQNVQQRVMPAINSQFMGSGRYGSGLHADSAARGMTEAFAPYASSMYQQGIDRMSQAASMAPTFAANDYTDIGALETIGQQRQQLGQRELDDSVERFDFYQRRPYDQLGQFLNNIGGNYGGTVVGRQPSNRPSMFQQIAGGGVGLLGSAISGGMFSDRRLKEDISRVGKLDDGTPVYSYRYKAGGPMQIGVMAQEIEGKYPDAVSTHASGYKMVDYGKLADAVKG